jgi:hypothetical protein
MNRVLYFALALLAASLVNSCADNRATGVASSDTESESQRWQDCATAELPRKQYSQQELRELVVPPNDVTQLLQNVKLIWQKNLLVQQSFYDPEVLKVFFSAVRVDWTTAQHPVGVGGGHAMAEISSSLPIGTITVDGRCQITPRSGTPTRLGVYGGLTIRTSPGLKITLTDVRKVFGPDGENVVDTEITTDGHIYRALYLGYVAYRLPDRNQPEGGALGAIFRFDSANPTSPRGIQIEPNDVLQQIEVNEAQEGPLEK